MNSEYNLKRKNIHISGRKSDKLRHHSFCNLVVINYTQLKYKHAVMMLGKRMEVFIKFKPCAQKIPFRWELFYNEQTYHQNVL